MICICVYVCQASACIYIYNIERDICVYIYTYMLNKSIYSKRGRDRLRLMEAG